MTSATMENQSAGEQSILGGILFEGENGEHPCPALDKARARLPGDEYFCSNNHKAIYRAMLNLADNNQPITIITVNGGLEQLGWRGENSLFEYLKELAAMCPTSANVEIHAQVVKDDHNKRSLGIKLSEAKAALKDGAESDKVAADLIPHLEDVRASSRSGEWPDPEPIPETLLPVPPFQFELLPESFGAWIEDISDRMQCPADYLAAASLVMLSGVLGRRISIFPKAHDNWLEPPNLWGGIVGSPGQMKSPSMREVFRPLKRLEEAARKQYDRGLLEHEAEKTILDAERATLKAKLSKVIKESGNVDEIKGELIALEERLADTTPTERRHIINDSTVEKLGVLLQANPKGLLVFRDELAGWLANMEKQGHESDRAFYLEAWDGKGSFVYDRIGRERTVIPHVCLSLFGTIQPGRLIAYLQDALGGHNDDGLFQRLQVMVYPNEPMGWKNVDRRPNQKVEEAVFRVVEMLDASTPQDLGAVPVDGLPDTFALHFSGPAQELFNSWRGDLENMVRLPDEHEALRGHFSKYRSLMPSIALILHLADVADGRAQPGPVSLEAAQKAAGWTAYLAEHTRRIYGLGIHAEISAARMLAQKIQSGILGAEFSERDIYRKGWTSLNEPERVRRACETLAGFKGWIRAVDVPAGTEGGRPTKFYRVNSKAIGGKP
jgi:putative DNA primase/helicase